MDNRLLIVKMLTLAYRENSFTDRNRVGDSSDLIKEAMRIAFKVENEQISDFGGKNPIVELRITLNQMLSHKSEEKYDKNELIQRVYINTEGDGVLYQALKEGIETDQDDEATSKQCSSIRKEIRTYIDEAKALDLLKVSYFLMKSNNGKVSPQDIVNEAIEKLSAFKSTGNADIVKTRGFTEVDINDDNSMDMVLDRVKEIKSGEGGIQFGMIDLNKMAGTSRKFRRGDSMLIPAGSYCFKSGTTRALIRQIAMHNIPFMLDPSKKPLIVLWSLEDDATNMIAPMFEALYFLERGTAADVSKFSNDEIKLYVKRHLGRNGYNVKFVRSDPALTDYSSIMTMCDKWKADGYEIHAMAIDYMAKMSTRGCVSGGSQGADLLDLFSRLRNFFSVENIFFFTPHQLNGEARSMKDNGVKDLVRRFAGSGVYYKACKDLFLETDYELSLNLTNYNTFKYLEYYMGKNRPDPTCPEGDRYVCYKICEHTGLRDDIESGKSSGLKRPPSSGGGFDII